MFALAVISFVLAADRLSLGAGGTFIAPARRCIRVVADRAAAVRVNGIAVGDTSAANGILDITPYLTEGQANQVVVPGNAYLLSSPLVYIESAQLDGQKLTLTIVNTTENTVQVELGERDQFTVSPGTSVTKQSIIRPDQNTIRMRATSDGLDLVYEDEVAFNGQLASTEGYNGRTTQQSLMEELKKKLQDEITTLEREFHHELPKEILRARELGDLSENAEYHAAKERQGFVNARLGQLRARLREVSMIDMTKIPKDRVGLGSRILVMDLTKDVEITYKLVTSEDADVAKGLISTSSPIGKGLLGKRVGDSVKIQIPDGMREMEILEVMTIHDLAAD